MQVSVVVNRAQSCWETAGHYPTSGDPGALTCALPSVRLAYSFTHRMSSDRKTRGPGARRQVVLGVADGVRLEALPFPSANLPTNSMSGSRRNP